MIVLGLMVGLLLGAWLAGTETGNKFWAFAVRALALLAVVGCILVALGWALGFWEVHNATW